MDSWLCHLFDRFEVVMDSSLRLTDVVVVGAGPGAGAGLLSDC